MTRERGLWLNFATVLLKTLPPNELGWDCNHLSQYGLFSIRKKTKVSGNLQAAARSKVLHFFRTQDPATARARGSTVLFDGSFRWLPKSRFEELSAVLLNLSSPKAD